jgi:hypothetical protein
MKQIIKDKDGFLFREQQVEDEKGNKTIVHIPFVDFVYGFSTRKGQKCPTLTLAVVPFIDAQDGDRLHYGVGAAYCSVLDDPVKAKGRAIAEARARAVINTKFDLKMKVYARDQEGPVPAQQAFVNPRIVGMCTHWEGAPLNASLMELSETALDRLNKSFQFIAQAVMPEIVA